MRGIKNLFRDNGLKSPDFPAGHGESLDSAQIVMQEWSDKPIP